MTFADGGSIINQLSDRDVVERMGLTQIVRQPIRGTNILDLIYVSSSDLYRTVHVVKSVVRSDHKAVVTCADKAPSQQKTVVQRPTRQLNMLSFCSTPSA